MKMFKVATLNNNKKEKENTKKWEGFLVLLNRFSPWFPSFLPLILRIPTLILRIPTLIHRIPIILTPIPHIPVIPLIPFPIPVFTDSQEMKLFMYIQGS